MQKPDSSDVDARIVKRMLARGGRLAMSSSLFVSTSSFSAAGDGVEGEVDIRKVGVCVEGRWTES